MLDNQATFNSRVQRTNVYLAFEERGVDGLLSGACDGSPKYGNEESKGWWSCTTIITCFGLNGFFIFCIIVGWNCGVLVLWGLFLFFNPKCKRSLCQKRFFIFFASFFQKVVWKFSESFIFDHRYILSLSSTCWIENLKLNFHTLMANMTHTWTTHDSIITVLFHL